MPAAQATMPGRNGKIAFVSYSFGSSGRVYVLDPDTGDVEGPIDPEPVQRPSALENYVYADTGPNQPHYSPDGKRIVWERGSVTCANVPSAGWTCTYGTALWVMNADGSNPVPVTTVKDAQWDTSPSWSPDGTTIIFARDTESTCGDLFSVTETSPGTWSEPVVVSDSKGCEWEPNFSPDGKKILYSYDTTAKSRKSEYPSGDGPESFKKMHFQLFVMNADGSGKPNQVSHFDDKQTVIYSTWSPDGKKIGFELGNNVDVGRGIFIMRADGSHVRRITRGADGVPSWSPDGNEIAFERGAGEEYEDLYAVSVTPPYRVRLLVGWPDHDGVPDWQPLPMAEGLQG